MLSAAVIAEWEHRMTLIDDFSLDPAGLRGDVAVSSSATARHRP
jgi:hypothetical protein